MSVIRKAVCGGIVGMLFFSFLTLPMPITAASNFSWASTTTIKNSDAGYSEFVGDTSSQSGTYYVFNGMYTDQTNPLNTTPYTLVVSKTNPLSGELRSGSGRTYHAEPISILDPNGYAPKTLKVITKGYIVGKVLPASNVSDVNRKAFLDDSTNNVYLHTDNGQTVGFSNDIFSRSTMYNSGASYYYRSFDISQARTGDTSSGIMNGLLPGRYRIVYDHSEGAVCATGQLQNAENTLADASQLLCTGRLLGISNFDLTYDEKANDGTGIITMVGNDTDEQASPQNGKQLNTAPDAGDFGINMTVDFSMTSPLDSALSGAIGTLGSFLQKTTEWVMGQINGLLTSTADYVVGPIGSTSGGVLGPWLAMRNIALTLLVMALVIIAFANALQIDIEQYGLNRMIPKIIISIIMAFASWVIVVFFFDFTKAIQDQTVGLIGGTGGLEAIGKLTLNVPTSIDIAAKIGAVILLVVLWFGVLACGLVLLFMLVMRIVMLSFLLAVAPLAFILNIVPFTANLYKQWWSEFWKWMFMGPVAMIIISLGSVIAASTSGQPFNTVTLDASLVNDGTGGRILIGLIVFGASLYLAATLPIQWGGKIMQNWNKLVGSKILGNIGGNYSANSLLKSGKSWLATRTAQQEAGRNAQLARWQDKVANSGVVGAKWAATGVTGATANAVAQNMHAAAVAQHGKALNMSDPTTTKEMLMGFTNDKYDKYTQEAAVTELMNRKLLDMDADELKRFGGMEGADKQVLFDKFAGSGAIRQLGIMNQKELVLGSKDPAITSDLKIKCAKKMQDGDISGLGSGELEAVVTSALAPIPDYTTDELAAAKARAKTTNNLKPRETEIILADINRETLKKVSVTKLGELDKKKGTKAIDVLAKFALTPRGRDTLSRDINNDVVGKLSQMRPGAMQELLKDQMSEAPKEDIRQREAKQDGRSYPPSDQNSSDSSDNWSI